MTPLQQKRLARSLSTDDVMKALEINRSRLSSYETGARTPPPELIKPYADLLAVTTDELVQLIAETQRERESKATVATK